MVDILKIRYVPMHEYTRKVFVLDVNTHIEINEANNFSVWRLPNSCKSSRCKRFAGGLVAYETKIVIRKLYTCIII